MKTTISADTTMYDLITKYPELKAVFVRIGFDQLANPLQLATVGRIMTLRKGAKMKGIDLSAIHAALIESDFQLEDFHE
ncbi:MAG: DUF1858 domain-containing protein [Bacillus subtilis]|nr:DUF1858 domain-containing protein [Bacillus subtilis]